MAPKGYLPRRRIELEAGGGGSKAKAKDASDFNEKKLTTLLAGANGRNFPVVWFLG